MRRFADSVGLMLCAALAGCGGESDQGGSILWSVEVEVTREGGFCAVPEGGGAVCSTTVVVADDGTWRASGVPEPEEAEGTAPVGAASELAAILERGWEDLTARPFEGTCPLAYDGQEVVYTVRRIPRGPGAERADASVREIRSCTYDLEHAEARRWVWGFLERWDALGLPE